MNNGSHFLRLILAADTREPSNDAMACSTNTIRIDPDDALAALHFPAPSAGRAELHGKPALGQVLLGFDRVCDFVELVLRLVQGGVLARGRAVAHEKGSENSKRRRDPSGCASVATQGRGRRGAHTWGSPFGNYFSCKNRR